MGPNEIFSSYDVDLLFKILLFFLHKKVSSLRQNNYKVFFLNLFFQFLVTENEFRYWIELLSAPDDVVAVKLKFEAGDIVKFYETFQEIKTYVEKLE